MRFRNFAHFRFFFLVAWRSSLFALKKILCMSFNSCGQNIMSYGLIKKGFAPDSGMQDSDLWESPHCREILWRPSIGRSWAHGCARQLLSNFWRFEFLYFWAIFAHNIALEHKFSTESQRFIQISQIFYQPFEHIACHPRRALLKKKILTREV